MEFSYYQETYAGTYFTELNHNKNFLVKGVYFKLDSLRG
jgi:hypothetical protein